MDKSESHPVVRQYKYYKILEVDKNATQDEIKRAFRRLANVYHPDANPKAEAHEKFKKINEANEVLSNPVRRASYDNSLAECPVCWTHEVIETIQRQWRCRHCGCSFDIYSELEIIEQLEQAAIKEKLREAVKLFQTIQCSWCSNFYTNEPFLCPSRRLQSSCLYIKKLTANERKKLLGEDKWWWRMVDMVQQVQDKGILGRCRDCGALNPNPQKYVCWQCGESALCCPSCQESPVLRYDIQKDLWKCPSAGCGKTFAIKPRRHAGKQSISKNTCPNCRRNLYYDTELLLWKCNHCKRKYTYQDLYSKDTSITESEYTRLDKIRNYNNDKVTNKSRNDQQPVDQDINSPFDPDHVGFYKSEYKMKKKENTGLAVIKTFLILLAFACLGFVGWTGYLLYKSEISSLEGIILLVVAIGVLIWNISAIKKYRVVAKTLILLFLVVVLLGSIVTAFAGVEPLSNMKSKVVDYIGSFNIGSSDIQARIVPKGGSGIYYNVQVELTPSDSVKLYNIFSIQLISESYSFGKSLVYWAPDDSRTIKTVTFMIPVNDKVATKLKNLDEESLAKLFSGQDLVDTTKWYESNVNKILKVKIIGNIELCTDASIYTEMSTADAYSVSAIITPTLSVVAGEIYDVALMQKVENEPYMPDGTYIYRSKPVSWRQSEIDSKQTKTVLFGNFAKDYWESYTFSIKVLPSK
jgi:ribosomal protein L37AE/L43A